MTSGDAPVIDDDLMPLPSNSDGGDEREEGVDSGRSHANLWAIYIGRQLGEWVKAVGPIASMLLFFQTVVVHRPIEHWGALALSLTAVVVGMALFTFGLFHALFPLGETLGKLLPLRLPLPVVLAVATLLGIVVTLAEPALGVVETVGVLLPDHKAHYLHLLLQKHNLALTLAVAFGVGIAAALGIGRIRKGWSLQSVLLPTLFATLALTVGVAYGTDKEEVVGLAWDLGAITTGPVTVPMVLALGLGVAGASGQTITPATGFGIVTLASLYPVITVLLLALCLGEAPIMESNNKTARSLKSLPVETLPETQSEPLLLPEFLESLRAMAPLLLLLWILLRVVLRERRPISTKLPLPGPHDTKAVVWVTAPVGILCAFFGLIGFKAGLKDGLNRLGDSAGAATPAAFMHLDEVPGSPFFSPMVGMGIAVVFVWLLGVGATLAEPALLAMAETVHTLSNGDLSKRQVMASVAMGVGCGLSLGVIKMIMALPLTPILVVGYTIAAVLTLPSTDLVINVAWDSAGVTTDAVTVPLVVSLGLGFGNALGLEDGFGLLAAASVGPIVSVLACDLIARWLFPRRRGLTAASPTAGTMMDTIALRTNGGIDDDDAR